LFSSLKLNKISAEFKSLQATKATLTLLFQGKSVGKSFDLLSKTKNYQRSVLSVVINTLDGVYDSFFSDNFCSEDCSNCISGECFEKFTSSYSSPDLKIFLAWGGSDIDGKQYLSQSQRLSRFNLYSVSSVYSNVKALSFWLFLLLFYQSGISFKTFIFNIQKMEAISLFIIKIER